MSYRETVNYLNSFINYERTLPRNYKSAFRLERTKKLLNLLGNPHEGLKIIHVGGTKGKGSTALLIASILKEANLTVGLYTSPHLLSCCERIRVNDDTIEEESLCAIVDKIRPHLDDMRDKGLSFFEIYTAVAFLYFNKKKVNFAVMEVGLGGRLDATNVVDKSISVITPISLEHTHILGPTLRKIAREKSDIIKKGSTAVSAPQEKEVLDIIEDVCAKRSSHLFLVGRDIHIDKRRFNQDIQYFNVWGNFTEYPLLELRLRGEHQIINAATAIGAIEALRMRDLFISQDAVRRGISRAEWPGRVEMISKDPFLVVDGAQNVASAKALIAALKRHFNYRRLVLILGISRDKDIKGICNILSEAASLVILTRADNPRAANPNRLRKYIKSKTTEVFLHSKDALQAAYSKARKEDLILITGSLFLVGEVKESEKRKAKSEKP